MSRSLVISTLPIFALFIVSTVVSAPRENIISQQSREREFRKTRETELLEEHTKHLQNEIFDVPREYDVLHRWPRVPREPLSKPHENKREESATMKSLMVEKSSDDSKLSVEMSEIKDMIESHVAPKDDDDTASDHEKSLSMLPKDKMLEANNSKINATAPLPQIIFPDKNDTNVDVRVVNDQWCDILKKSKYMTEETKINDTARNNTGAQIESVDIIPASFLPNGSIEAHSPIAESTTIAPTVPTTAAAPATTTTPATITTPKPAAPTTTKKELTSMTSNSSNPERTSDNPTTTTYQPTSSSPSPEELKLHEKKMPVPASMPSGVVALITAISFTIIAIVAYIGLLVRKRYLEWRYGNRELLVNDFDAADISNFEL